MSHTPDPEPRRTQPTWLLRVRWPASTEWLEVRLAAESLAQADAIARRRGLMVDPTVARRIDGPPDAQPFPTAAPGPLRCVRCRYNLDGLPARNSVIDCPECGFAQGVLAYNPKSAADAVEQAVGHRTGYSRGFAMGCLTSVGILLFAFFTLVVLAAA